MTKRLLEILKEYHVSALASAIDAGRSGTFCTSKDGEVCFFSIGESAATPATTFPTQTEKPTTLDRFDFLEL